MNEIEYAITNFEEFLEADIGQGDLHMCSVEIALAALREKAKREKGCEYCNTENNRYLTDDVYLASISSFGPNMQRVITSQNGLEYKVLLYCPMCGRKLEGNQ